MDYIFIDTPGQIEVKAFPCNAFSLTILMRSVLCRFISGIYLVRGGSDYTSTVGIFVAHISPLRDRHSSFSLADNIYVQHALCLQRALQVSTAHDTVL